MYNTPTLGWLCIIILLPILFSHIPLPTLPIRTLKQTILRFYALWCFVRENRNTGVCLKIDRNILQFYITDVLYNVLSAC